MSDPVLFQKSVFLRSYFSCNFCLHFLFQMFEERKQLVNKWVSGLQSHVQYWHLKSPKEKPLHRASTAIPDVWHQRIQKTMSNRKKRTVFPFPFLEVVVRRRARTQHQINRRTFSNHFIFVSTNLTETEKRPAFPSQECRPAVHLMCGFFPFQFDHWTDAQRKRVLEDLLSKCKSKQLDFTGWYLFSCFAGRGPFARNLLTIPLKKQLRYLCVLFSSETNQR